MPPVARLAIAALVFTPSLAAAQYFLRPLPGSFSRAYAISADGKALTGVYSPGGSDLLAYRWTPTEFGESLGELPGGSTSAFGFGISGTGGRVVGQSSSANGLEAFRYIDGPIIGLGDLPGGGFESSANAVDDGGSLIVGSSQSANGREAFFLLDQGGNSLQGLGDLPGGGFDSAAFGVSGSGGIVVGYGTSASGREAFRWNLFQGFTPLGDLPGGTFDSVAYDISDTGAVVGRGRSTAGDEAFRWTSTGGMVGLGDLPGGLFGSIARSVSGDGKVIVGQGSSNLGSEAFIWREGQGMTTVREALGDAMPAGWILTAAEGVSRDGRSVAGWGTDPQGDVQAWYAYLDSDVHWVGPSGIWGNSANWSGVRLPNAGIGAVVQGSSPVTVTTGGAYATQRSLTLGSATPGAEPVGLVVLPDPNGQLSLFVDAGLVVHPNATASVAGGARVAADLVLNYGLVNGSGRFEAESFVNAGNAVLRTQSEEFLQVSNQLGNLGIIEVRGVEGAPATLEVAGPAVSGEDINFGPGRGRFDLEDAEVRFLGGLTNQGDFNVNAGSVDVYGAMLSDSTGGLNVAAGATARFYGEVNNYAASMVDGVVEFRGQYAGMGIGGSGLTRLGAAVLPSGASTGPIEFGGDIELLSSSGMFMTLAGTDPATQVDKLVVAGTLTLNGVLAIALEGFTPSPGDTFDLFDAAALGGGFASVSLPTLAGASWDASQLATTGLLSVVAGAAGDFNVDGLFNQEDHDLWAANYGKIGATPGQGDANGDGLVNAADYTVWRDSLGGPANAVPEPAGLIAILAVLIVVSPRRTS